MIKYSPQLFYLKNYKERLQSLLYSHNLYPYIFLEEIAKILTFLKPESFQQKTWFSIIWRTQYFIQEKRIFQKIIQSGWEIQDFFGCHPIIPNNRCDFMGYIISPFQDNFDSFMSNNIISKTYTGSNLNYTRNLYQNKNHRISSLMISREPDPFLYIIPNLGVTKKILNYLINNQNSSSNQIRNRKFQLISKNLNIKIEELFGILNFLFEQKKIIHEYTGIYLPNNQI